MWEEGVFVVLIDEYFHVSCVYDVALKLFFLMEGFLADDFLYFCFELPCDVILLADFYLEVELLLVFGTVYRSDLGEGFSDVVPEVLGVFTAPVNKHHVGWLDSFDEFSGLDAICMGGKANLFDR